MDERDELKEHHRSPVSHWASKGIKPVFISHASQDAAAAQAVCAALEDAGFPCWIAPRDVLAGTLYADSIVRAINEASLFILILTARAVASAHVGKELERASSQRHPILALRLDSAPLTPAFEYFLNESQWVEVGARGVDSSIAQVVDAVRQHLSTDAAKDLLKGPSTARDTGADHRRGERASRKTWITVFAAAAIIGALAYLAANRPGSRRDVAPPGDSSASIAAAGEKSIAVLPFADMSEKRDQEYFADGMAEEILDLLVRIPGLKGHRPDFVIPVQGKERGPAKYRQRLGRQIRGRGQCPQGGGSDSGYRSAD